MSTLNGNAPFAKMGKARCRLRRFDPKYRLFGMEFILCHFKAKQLIEQKLFIKS